MKLSPLVETVSNADEESIIAKNGRSAAVLVGLDEYESWKETIAVRSDMELKAEIKKVLHNSKKRVQNSIHLRNCEPDSL